MENVSEILNDRQELFCNEYLKDLNGTKAAIRAGYSEKTAKEQAYQLLQIPQIQDRIAQLQKEAADRNKIQVDDVLQELKALAFWNIKDFVSGNKAVDISNLEKEKAKPIVGIKYKVIKTGRHKYGTVPIEIKLADKRAALVDLGKHLGIFQDSQTIKVSLESILTKYSENGVLTEDGLKRLAELIVSYQKNIKDGAE